MEKSRDTPAMGWWVVLSASTTKYSTEVAEFTKMTFRHDEEDKLLHFQFSGGKKVYCSFS
jgi:hypothetical protein